MIYISIGGISRPGRIVRTLQVNDMENTYICPEVAFSHLKNENKNEITELRLDVLLVCDKLIVGGEITPEIQREIDFAKKVKMEVVRLEKNGALRPLSE